MTTYQNTPPKEQTIDRRELIKKVCFDCYNNAKTRDHFQRSIRLLKPLITQNSKTPTLDEAYLDGITTTLTTLKGDTQ